MLYEVITDSYTALNTFPGLVHTARHVMEAGNARSRYPNRKEGAVITSYSIHYTKLYEHLAVEAGTARIRGEQPTGRERMAPGGCPLQ